MSEAGKSADAQLASDIADKSLQNSEETSKAADAAADGTQDDEEGEDDEGEEEVDGSRRPKAAQKVHPVQ